MTQEQTIAELRKEIDKLKLENDFIGKYNKEILYDNSKLQMDSKEFQEKYNDLNKVLHASNDELQKLIEIHQGYVRDNVKIEKGYHRQIDIQAADLKRVEEKILFLEKELRRAEDLSEFFHDIVRALIEKRKKMIEIII